MKDKPKKKILIVDDEAHIRLLIEQSLEDLENEEIEILSADNGADALNIIQDQRPGLVFLDVMMPNIDGYTVCRMIRRNLEMKDVYVVILTAKGQEYDRRLSEESGANNFITKPFDPDELLEIAKKVLIK
jgi:two-component system alkaline phosphatase synthesis response regulator PhoP